MSSGNLLPKLAAIAALTSAIAPASAATIIDLSATAAPGSRTALSTADAGMYAWFASTYNAGVANSISVYSQTLALGPGSYLVTPASHDVTPAAAFVAAMRFSNVTGCQSGGERCTQGFEHSYYLKIGAGMGTEYGYGGGIGPVPGNVAGAAYFDTNTNAFAHAASATFSLASTTNVTFYWLDDTWSDNQGGISLSVAAVPEPHEWAMMLAGLGIVGTIAGKRRAARGRG